VLKTSDRFRLLEGSLKYNEEGITVGAGLVAARSRPEEDSWSVTKARAGTSPAPTVFSTFHIHLNIALIS
jgi:hypothetical protein